MKRFSCAYLTALQQSGNKEAEKELIDRWGRIPESQNEAQGCRCCKPTENNNYFMKK